jgi:uncharacterized protein with PIN domain
MIVDTSALIAILRDEPEARACADAIENSAVRRRVSRQFCRNHIHHRRKP